MERVSGQRRRKLQGKKLKAAQERVKKDREWALSGLDEYRAVQLEKKTPVPIFSRGYKGLTTL